MVVKFQDLEIEHTAKYNEMKNKRKSLSSITFVVNEHLAGARLTHVPNSIKSNMFNKACISLV